MLSYRLFQITCNVIALSSEKACIFLSVDISSNLLKLNASPSSSKGKIQVEDSAILLNVCDTRCDKIQAETEICALFLRIVL